MIANYLIYNDILFWTVIAIGTLIMMITCIASIMVGGMICFPREEVPYVRKGSVEDMQR